MPVPGIWTWVLDAVMFTWRAIQNRFTEITASWPIKVSIAAQKFATSALWTVRVVIQPESSGWNYWCLTNVAEVIGECSWERGDLLWVHYLNMRSKVHYFPSEYIISWFLYLNLQTSSYISPWPLNKQTQLIKLHILRGIKIKRLVCIQAFTNIRCKVLFWYYCCWFVRQAHLWFVIRNAMSCKVKFLQKRPDVLYNHTLA